MLGQKEISVRRMRQSTWDENSRIELSVEPCTSFCKADDKMLLKLCQQAKPDPSDSKKVIIRCAFDYVPIFDLKFHAQCYSSTGTSGNFGGLGSSVDKDSMFNPELTIMEYAEFIKDEEANRVAGNVFWHCPEYWEKCSDSMQKHMDAWKIKHPTADEKTTHDEELKCASDQKHGFVKSRTEDGRSVYKPYSFMDTVFKCVLHLDTNFGATIVNRIEDYAHQLAADRKLDYRKDASSPHRKWHNVLIESEALEPIAVRLMNRLSHINQDPQDFRLLGPHVIALFALAGKIDAALKVDNESPAEWLQRNVLVTMLILHRGIATMHSKFKLKRSEVPILVEMGKYLHRLMVHMHEPITYNFWYMCVENPQNLLRHIERFAIDDTYVLGLQALGCSQGPEAFHHDSKTRLAMQTSGRPGCHFDHLTNNLLLRVAGNDLISTRFEPHARHIHRIPDVAVEGACCLCSGILQPREIEGIELPEERSANSIMSEYFLFQQPLCASCADGRVSILLDICVNAGGLVKGSKCAKIVKDTSYTQKRKADMVKYDQKYKNLKRRAESVAAQKGLLPTGLPELADVLNFSNIPKNDH